MATTMPQFTTDCNYPGCEFHQREIAVICSILIFLSTAAFTLRLVARQIVKSAFSLDDWLSLVALACSLATNSLMIVAIQSGYGMHDIQIGPFNVRNLLKMELAVGMIWVAATSAAKFSLLFFYCRLFPNLSLRRLCYILAGLVAAAFIVGELVLLFECKPISFFWNRALVPVDPSIQGECKVNVVVFYAVMSVLNMLTDIGVFLLPVPVIWHLQISVKKKIGLTFAFTIGIFICAVSIIRLTMLHALAPADVAWDQVKVGLWLCTESAGATIDSCIPTFTPVVLRLLGHRVRADSKSRYGLNSQDPLASRTEALLASRGMSALGDRKDRPLGPLDVDDEEALKSPVRAQATPLPAGELHPNHGAPPLAPTKPHARAERNEPAAPAPKKGFFSSFKIKHSRGARSSEDDRVPLSGIGDIAVVTEMKQTSERRDDRRSTLAGVNFEISASKNPIRWRGINAHLEGI